MEDIPWTIVVPVVEVVWILAIGTIVVMQRRSASATMAWLLALAFLPLVGFLVYRMIGPQRLARRKLKRLVGRKAVESAMVGLTEAREGAPDHARLALVPIGAGESAPLAAHGVVAYTTGRDAYAAILGAIAAATHHVHLEYYIWEPDRIGTRLRDALVERAKAGIEVRMLVDGTGANGLRRRWLRPLRDAGVQVAFFNPVTLRTLRGRRRADFRTHRKIVVCDGTIGFTGGMNIVDNHSEEFGKDYWRDTHLKFEGVAVAAMQRAFLEDWHFAAGQVPVLSAAYFPAVPAAPAPSAAHDAVQVVASGPDTDAFAIHKTFFSAIMSARDRVWITTPYFVPDQAITAALVGAALQRVDVCLIVPRKGDSRIVDWAARSYFEELLRHGVRIYEYVPRFNHAKTMVIDDEVSIVGTANLDYRSFRLNFEIVAVVYGKTLAAELAAAFRADLAVSHEVTLGELAVDGFWRRFGQSLARLLSPLL